MPVLDVGAVRTYHAKFLREHGLMIHRELKAAGGEAKKDVYRRPKFTPRTGKLQSGTGYRIIRTAHNRILRIENPTKYAEWVERGTGPHIIRARRGGLLRFFLPKIGSWISVPRVRHPGTKPYWFLRRATFAAGDSIESRFQKHMNRIARRFGKG